MIKVQPIRLIPRKLTENLEQLCPARGTRAACGPREGFVRPSLFFFL